MREPAKSRACHLRIACFSPSQKLNIPKTASLPGGIVLLQLRLVVDEILVDAHRERH